MTRSLMLPMILCAWAFAISSASMKAHHGDAGHCRCMCPSAFVHPAINAHFIRHRPAHATPVSEFENVSNSNNNTSGTPFAMSASRCSSRDAASIIQNSSPHDGLLIITCDASGRGGGSKHDGIASILRIRHGSSLVPQKTAQCTKGDEDLIDVTARRTVPSRTSSEVAAVSLGIKRAMRTVPSICRKQVLILSDSEFALDFFCRDEKNAINDIVTPLRRAVYKQKRRKGTASSVRGKRQITQSMESREEAHRRSLLSLLKETPEGILFSKVKSSSRGVTINAEGEEDDSSWDGIGFIDHDAADHLSSVTRSVANSYNDEETIDLSNVAQPLGKEDMAWLEHSDCGDPAISANENGKNGSSKSSGFWKSMEVVGSEARGDRKKRSERRTEIIQEMLGSSLKGA